MDIVREIRDLNRFNHIVIILFEEGFGYYLNRIRLGHHIPFFKKLKAALIKKQPDAPEVRLRKTLERLGPTFIKFGQLLSIRPDKIPSRYAKELEKLQQDTLATPFPKIKKILEHELKKPLHEVFRSFNETPVASASISQVHKAVLKSGETVAVKIKKPNVDHMMLSDIEIMHVIAKLVEKNMPRLRPYEPVSFVKEFEAWTLRELDFRTEAKNASRFREDFRDSDIVYIPKVYREFTTSSVLVTEFIDGIPLHNIEAIKKNHLNIKKVIDNGFNSFLKQVFIHGMFHADPYPGNILVMKNNKISLVDFGIVGYFDDNLKNKCIEFFYGIINEDPDRIIETLIALGAVDEKKIDMHLFKLDVKDAIEPLRGSEIKDIKVSRVMEDVLDIALHYGIKMPVDFVLFGKTIVTLEGIALEYDPSFRIIEHSKPFLAVLIRKKLSPKIIVKNLSKEALKFKDFLTSLPIKTDKALQRIAEGKIHIDIEETDIKKLALEIDRSSNRVAYGLVIASLIVAGAWTATIREKLFFGLPVISLVTFITAFIFIAMLFSSIIKEKKM